MYDVGQGDSIKQGGGKVFSIKLKDTIADTLYPCHYDEFNPSQKPIQIPLGAFNKQVLDDYNGYKSLDEKYKAHEVENYEPETQHTNAGEISDIGLLFIISIVCIILLYVMFRK